MKDDKIELDEEGVEDIDEEASEPDSGQSECSDCAVLKPALLDLHDIIATPTRNFSEEEVKIALKVAKELIDG